MLPAAALAAPLLGGKSYDLLAEREEASAKAREGRVMGSVTVSKPIYSIQLADPQYNLPDGGQSLGVPLYDEWLPLAIGVIKDYVVKLGDGPFFAGKTPGFGEAFVWHNLDNAFALAKADIAAALGEADMAKLRAFYDKFAALDGVKDYLAKRPTAWGVPGSKASPQ